MVVPTPGRQCVLQQLHEGHPGMARMYMWWPRMDEEVSQVVCSCHECQKNHELHCLKHLSNLGVGQNSRGPGFIWTLLARC